MRCQVDVTHAVLGAALVVVVRAVAHMYTDSIYHLGTYNPSSVRRGVYLQRIYITDRFCFAWSRYPVMPVRHFHVHPKELAYRGLHEVAYQPLLASQVLLAYPAYLALPVFLAS